MKVIDVFQAGKMKLITVERDPNRDIIMGSTIRLASGDTARVNGVAMYNYTAPRDPLEFITFGIPDENNVYPDDDITLIG